MIRASGFTLRHTQRGDLPTVVPLLSDLDSRAEYLPSALDSPLNLEKIEADGLASGAYTRLLIIEQRMDWIIGSKHK